MRRPSQGCLGFWVKECPDVGIHWNRTLQGLFTVALSVSLVLDFIKMQRF